MSKVPDKVLPYTFRYGAMPLQTRRQLLPERSICSLYPARNYDDAFITGDGSQRVDILGDPYNDELQFTQELLYEPVWVKTPEPPDLRGILPTVRGLLLEGKFTEASELVELAQKDAGFGKYMNFDADIVGPTNSLRRHTAFWLRIRQPESGKTKNYLRWLDLMNGKISARWENALGAFARDTFIAYNGDIAVTRLTAPKGALNADITIRLPGPARGMSGLRTYGACRHSLEVTEDLITLKWAYTPEYGQKGYVSVIRFLRQGGSTQVIENSVRISGADSLMLLSKTVRFESDFTFDCARPVAGEVLAAEPDYEKLLASNQEYIGSRMARSRIRLGKPDDCALSGEELLTRTHAEGEFDGMLLEKLYDMGRFFQIVDTGSIPPMWGQHNINTNLQVCAGNNTGLFDEMDVYYRYYESKFDDFRTNAKLLFGARGLLASVHCDYNSGLYYHFSRTYPHYCWTGCLGWIYNELWGSYLITGDLDFLRNRIVPALKEIALFFEDYACDKGPDGKVLFYPSFSPENPTPVYMPTGNCPPASINSVMDIMICREVLDNLIEACKTLGIETESVSHWEAQRAALPSYLADEEGGLKEWAWPSIDENFNHRHVSHHYAVWPGHAVTWEDEPELSRAIQISNRKRGQQDDSAHGIIHRLLTAIRLKDLPETVQNLYQLMNQGFILRTLCANHYPYRVHCPDLTGAMPAILLEMAVFSAPSTVEFLPAMPASLGTGTLEGVWLYTRAKLERMDWSESGLKAVIVSSHAQTLTLRCRRKGAIFTVNGRPIPAQGDHIVCDCAENETLTVEIGFGE